MTTNNPYAIGDLVRFTNDHKVLEEARGLMGIVIEIENGAIWIKTEDGQSRSCYKADTAFALTYVGAPKTSIMPDTREYLEAITNE